MSDHYQKVVEEPTEDDSHAAVEAKEKLHDDEDDRLSDLTLRDKIGYAMGTLGNCANYVIGFFWNNFLYTVVQLDPAYASTAQLIAKIWDAIMDPVIGYLTDRTRTRFGRRRPWLLGAAIPCAIFFLALWLRPEFITTQEGLFAYYLIIFCLQRTSYTSYVVPYAAFTMELSDREKDRNSLTSWRFFAGGIANLICVLAMGLVDRYAERVGGILTAFKISALFVAILVLFGILACFFILRERDFEVIAKDTHTLNLKDAIVLIFKNKSFVLLTGMSSLAFLSLQLIQSNLLLFLGSYVKIQKQTAFQGILVALAVLIVTVPVIRKLLNFVSKKTMWIVASFVVITWGVCAFVHPIGSLGYMYFLSAYFGIALGIVFYLPWTMVPDVIDWDELHTGVRREGFYYSIFIFFEKIAGGLGLSVSGYILSLRGYDPQDPTTAPVAADTFRYMVSLGPGILMLLTLILLYFYPITRTYRAQIQRDLIEKRKAARDEVNSMLLTSDKGTAGSSI